MTIDLAGDLLDKRIQDRNGRYMGTVDSVVLEAGADGAAKVVAIEIGVPALARRLHPRLERWARRFPLTRLPIAKLQVAGNDIQADVDAERHSTLLAIEKWLRSHIVDRIPGHAR
jgi:hypothetical protein